MRMHGWDISKSRNSLLESLVDTSSQLQRTSDGPSALLTPCATRFAGSRQASEALVYLRNFVVDGRGLFLDSCDRRVQLLQSEVGGPVLAQAGDSADFFGVRVELASVPRDIHGKNQAVCQPQSRETQNLAVGCDRGEGREGNLGPDYGLELYLCYGDVPCEARITEVLHPVLAVIYAVVMINRIRRRALEAHVGACNSKKLCKKTH